MIMETTNIIAHNDKMNAICEMIVAEHSRVKQIENLEKEKNWLYYSMEEMLSEKKKYSYKLAIRRMALERLKNYYINNSTIN